MNGVEQFLRSITDEKIVTLNWLHKILVTASSGQFVSSLSEAALGTVLHWLSVQVSLAGYFVNYRLSHTFPLFEISHAAFSDRFYYFLHWKDY